jgi:hypothetical protein
VLLHCFGGCEVAAVCDALGIELRDLFSFGIRRRRSDEVDDELRRRITPREVLEALNDEIATAAYIVGDLIQQGAIDDENWKRLALAHRRVSAARALISPARLSK